MNPIVVRVLRAVAIIVTASAVLGMGLQPRPDFSGAWAIDSPPPTSAPSTGVAPSNARPDQARLVAGDMGSGWGSPITITQDATQLRVESSVFSRYDANPQPQFVYALDGSESRNTVMLGHASHVRVSRAAWDGQTLRITTQYPGRDPDTGKSFTTEVIQRLTLESPAALVIDVTRGAVLGGSASTTRTVYRRR